MSLGGGFQRLEDARSIIVREIDQGRLVALVLDADDDPVKRRKEVQTRIAELALPVERLYLLPNDRSAGCLETLLLQLSERRHRGIHECFRQYEQCLRQRDGRTKCRRRRGAYMPIAKRWGLREDRTKPLGTRNTGIFNRSASFPSSRSCKDLQANHCVAAVRRSTKSGYFALIMVLQRGRRRIASRIIRHAERLPYSSRLQRCPEGAPGALRHLGRGGCRHGTLRHIARFPGR